MTAVTARTNGDRVQPWIDRGGRLLAGLAAWAREHPDELAVSAAPMLMLATATRRHRLNVAEAVLIAEVGYWCGLAACHHYRKWKTRPAGPSRLREVV